MGPPTDHPQSGGQRLVMTWTASLCHPELPAPWTGRYVWVSDADVSTVD